MAGKDFNYISGGPISRIPLTGDQSTPSLLKKAITLFLFSKDERIRNFNGGSIVNAFSTLPSGGVDAISHNLTVAATRITEILRGLDSTVDKVYITCAESGSKLSVAMNIRLVGSADILTEEFYG